MDSYRESHVVHDDDVEQLKRDIATKGKHIDDLQGKLDALKKVTHILNSSLLNTRDVDLEKSS